MKKWLGIDSILNKEKGQWWRTLDVYKIVRAVIEPASAVKSLTSFSTSFLRYCKDIAKFTHVIWTCLFKPIKNNRLIKDFPVY